MLPARVRVQSRSRCSTVYKPPSSYQRPFTRLSQYRHVPTRSPTREGSPQWITEDELVYLSPFNCLSHGEKDRLGYPEHSVLVASTAPWAIRNLRESVGTVIERFGSSSSSRGSGTSRVPPCEATLMCVITGGLHGVRYSWDLGGHWGIYGIMAVVAFGGVSQRLYDILRAPWVLELRPNTRND